MMIVGMNKISLNTIRSFIMALILTSGTIEQMPNKVYPHEVSNNSRGLICYKNQPYTGKVLGDNNGYLLVRNGIAKNLIICHDNGNIAINISIENSTMIFKDKNGEQITKDVFLKKYPSFRRITNEWDSVKLR